MSTKTQKSIISIMLTLALVIGCFAAMPLTSTATATELPGPASENKNQDFRGTTVEATVVPSDDIIYVGASAVISIIIDRTTAESKQVTGSGAMPDVSIWVNGEQFAFYSSIKQNTGKESLEFSIDTSEAGLCDFVIRVLVHTGAKPHEHAIYEKTISIDVVENQPTADETLQAILDAIGDGPLVIVPGTGHMILNINGVDVFFRGGNGNNAGTSAKNAVVNGYYCIINPQGSLSRYTVSVYDAPGGVQLATFRNW
jgi:hypothetical protein